MSNAINTKVLEALNASEAFSALLDKETDALKRADYNTFADMQDEKIYGAQRYQESVLSLEPDVDFLKSIDNALKDKLREAHARFRLAADANESALLASKKVAERIVSLIMDAAKRGVQEAPNYGAMATQTVSAKIPLHFKVNEVL